VSPRARKKRAPGPGRPRTARGSAAPYVFVRVSPAEDEALTNDAERGKITKAEVLRRARFGAPKPAAQ
jgi:hypothetical protein